MKQKIIAFHQDPEMHWVANLACGHKQHTRHDPPWQERRWVISEEGRNSRLGEALNCVRCDELAQALGREILKVVKEGLVGAYESAGLSGLCSEGRWEMALDSLSSIDIQSIAERSLASG